MKYVVAVSGGVDSMVLLHILAKQSPHSLVSAHVDHGIRPDSSEDARLVREVAKQYGILHEETKLNLGQATSEAVARRERYKWLDGIKRQHRAMAVATAHHQDDLLETVVLNLGRGTGWRGLASLRDNADRYRPLLGVSKAALVSYALDHKLVWREDSTNDDLRYSRNYLRHGVMPRMSVGQRRALAELSEKQQQLRQTIEQDLNELVRLVQTEQGLSRYWLIMLPEAVSLEVLRCLTHGQYQPAQLVRLLRFVKTGRQGAVMQLGNGHNALLTRQHVLL